MTSTVERNGDRTSDIANEFVASLMKRGNPLMTADLQQEWRDRVTVDIDKLFTEVTSVRIKVAVIETKMMVYSALISVVTGIATAYVLKHIGG